MTTEADIKEEIARLTATINQHKSTPSYAPSGRGGRGGYRGRYGAPSYSAAAHNPPSRPRNNKYIRPGLERSSTSGSGNVSVSVASQSFSSGNPSTLGSTVGEKKGSSGKSSPVVPVARPSLSSPPSVDGKKEIVIGGVAFESSSRSLVRKDLPKPKPLATKQPSTSIPFVRKAGHLISTSRSYKPKSRRGHGRNMTLDNTRKSWTERVDLKRRKYLNKPCPRFTTTGVCNRGLTCMYQHDSSKIAICWNFLQDNCPNTAETCHLSHDPTPERTPLCLHFLNKGRCTRVGCLFPHVNVGKRDGVCRDFAVLGYCEKGYDCDKQHVRECPDFAENGTCSTKGCKLPHVIRANRGRKAASSGNTVNRLKSTIVDAPLALSPGDTTDLGSSSEEKEATLYAEDGKLGDEFISLTFHESEDEGSDDDEEDEEEEEGDAEEENGEENEDEAGDNDSETI